MQTMFFSTFKDNVQIIREIEELVKIKYYKTGVFETSIIPEYFSLISVPGLGFAKFDDSILSDKFLVIPENISLNIREIFLKKGGIRYAVDQLVNQITITISMGGIYEPKEKILVAGMVSTISKNEFAIKLYKTFVSKIKKHFKKIGGYYVGKEAEEMLKNNWRLVQNAAWSSQYDLSVPKK